MEEGYFLQRQIYHSADWLGFHCFGKTFRACHQVVFAIFGTPALSKIYLLVAWGALATSTFYLQMPPQMVSF